MNLFPSEEQSQLRDSVGRFLKDCSEVAHTPGVVAEPNLQLWQGLASLGVMALAIPEAYGGLDRGFEDVAQVMEEAGEVGVPLPLVTAFVCAGLLAALGNREQCERWLTRVGQGDTRFCLAIAEPRAVFDGPATDLRATRTSEGWRLSGRKRLVLDFPGSECVLVTAFDDGEQGAQILFIVPTRAPGLQALTYSTLDGRAAADLTLSDVDVSADQSLGGPEAVQAIRAAMDDAVIAGMFEAVGIMRALLKRTINHANTRKQFSRPLADNQALQHRLADMAVQLEEASAIALRALLNRLEPPAQRAYAVSSAKVKVSKAARIVSEGAIQIHGAMGITEELDVGARTKRLMAIDLAFGTPAEHQARLVSLRAEGMRPCAANLGEPQ